MGNGTSAVPPTPELTEVRRFVPVEEPLVRASDLVEVDLGLSWRFLFGGRLPGGPITGDTSLSADAIDVQVSYRVCKRYDESNSKNPNSLGTGGLNAITTAGADGCTACIGAVNSSNVPIAHVRIITRKPAISFSFVITSLP